jgi:hypothetical protein
VSVKDIISPRNKSSKLPYEGEVLIR